VTVDFGAEGLLDGLDDAREREDRRGLLQDLLDGGVALDELRSAVAEDRLVLLGVERALGQQPARYSREEVAERAGLELDFLRRLWRAMGMPEAAPDQRVLSEGDLEAARLVRQALAAGMPETGLLELSRVMGQSMANVSAAIGGVFAQSFVRPGDSERDLAKRYTEAAEALQPSTLPLLAYMLGLHQRQQVRQNVIGRAQIAEGRLDGGREIAVCFADLVGFTRLGETVPPSELGAVAGRLAELAAEVAEGPVRIVKMIGDAAMLVSYELEPLVGAALSLVDAADEQGEDFPQLRAGIAKGQALGRGGDWYGRPVNLASRVGDIARPGSALATEEVKDAVGEERYRWSFAGARKLKGLRESVPLYRVRRRPPDPPPEQD
jgi:adenylate cyclase